LNRYLEYLAVKTARLRAVRVYIACHHWKNAELDYIRLRIYKTPLCVIILNNSTRVYDADIKIKLACLDLHRSALKWVAEFESGSLFGRLFRKWI
jgi:hypothetical protein